MTTMNETKNTPRKLRDGMIKSRKTRIGDLVIAFICLLLMLLCLLPMLHVLAASLSSPEALVRNEVFIWPKGWNIEAYKTVLTTENLRGGKFINFIILFTMYFSAGTIPYYLLLSRLGMLNTPYALIFPNCISVFNVIIMRSFFYGVPDSLREAAEIDGAGPIRVLIRVYLPLSLPVIATLSLFYAVGRWNGFSDALMYLKKSESEPYWPIQLLLYNVIKNSTQTSEQAAQEGFFQNGVSKTIQMATVMFATVPILLVYPWLQRYFVTGVTIGAVKG